MRIGTSICSQAAARQNRSNRKLPAGLVSNKINKETRNAGKDVELEIKIARISCAKESGAILNVAEVLTFPYFLSS